MSDVCPICQNKLLSFVPYQYGSGTLYSCKDCGTFVIEDHCFRRSNFIPYKIRSAMYYHLTQQVDRDLTICVIFHNDRSEPGISIIPNVNGDRKKSRQLVNIRALEANYPGSIDEHIEMVLVNLNHQTPFLGGVINLPGISKGEMAAHLFFFDDASIDDEDIKTQYTYWLTMLRDSGYIIQTNSGYKITLEGYSKINERLSKRNVSKSVFIAMSFDPSFNDAYAAISKAIEDCGFTPTRIDEKEHNNQIVPEILFEIRRSRFVVADISDGNRGVYYEAGYAEGIEKPVILTCKKDNFNDARHFDVAQKNTVQWQDEEELCERLRKRIESTITPSE